jgi:hypothetical protein
VAVREEGARAGGVAKWTLGPATAQAWGPRGTGCRYLRGGAQLGPQGSPHLNVREGLHAEVPSGTMG